jgi:hypothetical protein
VFWRILPAQLIPSHLLLLSFHFVFLIPVLPVALCPFNLFVVVVIICFSCAHFYLFSFNSLIALSTWFLLILVLFFHIFFTFSFPCSVSYPYVLCHLLPFLISCFRILRMRLTLAECHVISKSKLLIDSSNQPCEANSTGNWVNIFTCHPFPLSQTPLTSRGIFNASVTLKWHLQ